MTGPPQTPLYLRFNGKPFWGDLRRELGVDETGAAVVLDICNADGMVSYSRTARHYDIPPRYQNGLWTYRKIVGAVDHLDREGLIHHDRRAPGVRGWQSAMRATDELRRIVQGIIADKPMVLSKPRELILLRDKSGKLIDYKDTRALDRMRRRCAAFNEAIANADLDPTIASPLVRIFNINTARGGRFYFQGASVQNMKAETRRYITIGGEPVVELDFKCLHPAILYAEVGQQMPHDCYDLDGWPRKLVKVALLILINAPTVRKARLAIAHHDAMQDIAPLGSQDALRAADSLIDAIKVMHRPIAHGFHSDAGARLMNVDSELAETVMNVMMMQGIAVLPIHDSFLVQKSKRDQLEEAMLEAAHAIGMWAMQVEQK